MSHLQGGPALNQFGSMASKGGRPVKAKPKGVRRGVAAGVGLTAASMLAAQSADAADLAGEVVQQAASSDGRFGIIASLVRDPLCLPDTLACLN